MTQHIVKIWGKSFYLGVIIAPGEKRLKNKFSAGEVLRRKAGQYSAVRQMPGEGKKRTA